MTDPHQVADIFNARAERYVNDDWHQRYAEQLVAVTPLHDGDRVPDAGTGTGFAACAIARRVGLTSHVLAVDISPRMLEQARIVIRAAQLGNVDCLEADVSDLRDLGDSTFDAVVCSAGLLYMPVAKALQEWRRLLKTDGVVAFFHHASGLTFVRPYLQGMCRKVRFGRHGPDRSPRHGGPLPPRS